jgi:flagellar hook-basal body complex protein FliE
MAIPSDDGPSFADQLRDSLDSVARSQNEAAQLVRDYEIGKETDLTKVMVSQQVSSLGFQLTLNIRNKAMTAYKDIMNMPV